MLPKSQIKKFAQINERIRAEEIEAREHLRKISSVLDLQVGEGLLDDYETETRFSVYSYNEAFCKSRQIKVGSPLWNRYLFSFACVEQRSPHFKRIPTTAHKKCQQKTPFFVCP